MPRKNATPMAVIAQKVGSLQLASPQLSERREMPAEGQTYIVGQGGSVRAGDVVTLTLTGLPHRSRWPANVALLISAVILLAGAWGAVRVGRSPQQSTRRVQLQARRDKLFSELAALELPGGSVKVVTVKGQSVRLGVTAPAYVVVDRSEVHERRNRMDKQPGAASEADNDA